MKTTALITALGFALFAAPAQAQWRTETYEFVDNPIAIDLLCGSAEARVGLHSRVRPRDLVTGWKPELAQWEELRAEILLYARDGVSL